MGRLGIVLGLVLAARTLGAQPYDLAWHTVDGGGAASAGGVLRLEGTIGQPDAGGPFTGGAFVLHSGFWSLVAGGTPAPQADLSVTKTDGQPTATPGQPVTYAIVVGNAGPAAVTGAAVTDAPPAALLGVTWSCTASPGSSCPASGSGGISHPVSLLVGGTATFSLTGTVAPDATGTLANTASVTAPAGVVDPTLANNSATDTDTLLPPAAKGELFHGTNLRSDLASLAGSLDVDVYRVRQEPYASYEVVLDETSGDIGAASGPALERLAADGVTVLQGAEPVGSGPSRSLRFQNTTPAAVDGELVRVRSTSCASDCGADDVYRLRAWDTTGSIARFNNSASQVTVVILQSRSPSPVAGRIHFWSAAGTLVHEHLFTLPPRGTLVLNTASIGALAGQGGSATVTHDAPYGMLAGKAVAVEPATGFSFDSPLETRRR